MRDIGEAIDALKELLSGYDSLIPLNEMADSQFGFLKDSVSYAVEFKEGVATSIKKDWCDERKAGVMIGEYVVPAVSNG